MTLSTTTSRISYLGAGSAGPFAFPFRVFAHSDLLVTKRSVAGAETTLGYIGDYTVSGVGNPTGSATLVTALAVGERLVIRRVVDLTQETSLRNDGPYFPATIEDEFDRLAMADLQQQDQLDRSLRLAETLDATTFDLIIRELTAGKVLTGTGTGLTMAAIVTADGVVLPGDGRTVATLSAYLANNAQVVVEDYGAVADGVTDNSHAIAAAIATGKDVRFGDGIYGYTTGFTVSTPGQKVYGSGQVDMAAGQLTGTTLKKLSGNAVCFTVPIYTHGVEISGFGFDQNNLPGSAIITGGHRHAIRDVNAYQQGGTDYAFVFSGVNLSNFHNIRVHGSCYAGVWLKKHAVAGYSALYSSFSDVDAVCTTGYSIKIGWAESVDFFHTTTENPIYINDSVRAVRFFGLDNESDKEILIVDGSTGDPITGVSVIGGKSNALSTSTNLPKFRFTKAAGIKVSDFDILDEFSQADTPYFLINELKGFTFRDITLKNNSGAVRHFPFQSTGLRSDYGVIDRILDRVGSGTLLMSVRLGSGEVSNTNIPLAFNGTSQLMTLRNIGANVDTANCANGLTLLACNNVTDVGILATRVGYAGSISAVTSVASQAALPLNSGIDNTGNVYRVTGVTNITSISASDSVSGRTVTLIFAGILTFTDGNNLKLNAALGNFVTAADSTITLVCYSGNWHEITRSAN